MDFKSGRIENTKELNREIKARIERVSQAHKLVYAADEWGKKICRSPKRIFEKAN